MNYCPELQLTHQVLMRFVEMSYCMWFPNRFAHNNSADDNATANTWAITLICCFFRGSDKYDAEKIQFLPRECWQQRYIATGYADETWIECGKSHINTQYSSTLCQFSIYVRLTGVIEQCEVFSRSPSTLLKSRLYVRDCGLWEGSVKAFPQQVSSI